MNYKLKLKKSLKVLHIKFTLKIYFRISVVNIKILYFQTQISTKLSEVLNVIDMLNGIIGKESDEEEDRKESDSDSSPERIKNKLLESMGKKKEVDEK